MSYLSIAKFWKYQNADVWKKSKGHPPWFKHYVHRDRELDKLDLPARLLFYELLAAATRYSNVLEADLKQLWAETRIDENVIREHLPTLIKGGWIHETSTVRRSRKLSRTALDDSRDLKEEEEDEDREENPLAAPPPSETKPTKPREPDLLWEALVIELQTEPETKSERGRWNTALKELRDAGATAEDIHIRSKVYRRRWPDIALTPTALSGHWGELKPKQVAVAPCEQCGVGGGLHAADCPVVKPFTDEDIKRVGAQIAARR